MTFAVTGVGAVTALGATAEETWRRVIAGERGFRDLTLFAKDGYRATVVGEVEGVPRGAGTSRTSELALRAAREALGGRDLRGRGRRRVGLVVGGTTAGMLETESLLATLARPDAGPESRKRALVEMLTHPLSAPTDRLEKELGPFARVRTISTACSSGANALLVGATWLELGLVDAVLCGAADALCRVTLAGFNALGAMDPAGARPFDRRRRGLTLGEGAGFLFLERAEETTAAPICTLLGWASRSEAHHVTNPEPTGQAPLRAMKAALARAGYDAADVDYVNAHGTGTPLNDPMETRALAQLLGDRLAEVPVSSQKGQIGHTLAAAGAVEAVLSALAIQRGIVPPTGGLEEPDPECGLFHVPRAIEKKLALVLSSSFGFGGMDTVLALGAPDAKARAEQRSSRRVFVSGLATLGPTGLAAGADVAKLVDERASGEDVGVDLGTLVDAERGRRLDRASKLAAIAAERALGDGPRGEVGVVVGQAFGAVDPTAAFMKRLEEKGPRFVGPAEFPGLVPSAPAGHVSIYLGLGGPAFVVADLAASGEASVTQGFELVASGEVDRIVVTAAEERSELVERIFGVLFGTSSSPRREGAAAIALSSSADGALAEIEAIVPWRGDAPALPAPLPGAIVVVPSAGGATEAMLARSTFAACPRVTVDAAFGTHEAAGGAAIAVACALVLRGDAPLALAVGTRAGAGYAVAVKPCAR